MWKVFAVKTIYRSKAIGKPRTKDEFFSDELDLIEERVVTVKARNADEAIAKGKKEAENYAAESVYLNPYGQKVVQKYIGIIDVYEPFDDIPANLEVFSTTYLVKNAVTNSALTDRLFGELFDNERALRRKFQNREFTGIIS